MGVVWGSVFSNVLKEGRVERWESDPVQISTHQVAEMCARIDDKGNWEYWVNVYYPALWVWDIT
jgi:hypothetical protein